MDFSTEWVILKRAEKYELAVQSAEALAFQSTQSYILSFPSTDLDLECALMNFMHANFQLRTLQRN